LDPGKDRIKTLLDALVLLDEGVETVAKVSSQSRLLVDTELPRRVRLPCQPCVSRKAPQLQGPREVGERRRAMMRWVHREVGGHFCIIKELFDQGEWCIWREIGRPKTGIKNIGSRRGE
jgi:hypothetical protein